MISSVHAESGLLANAGPMLLRDIDPVLGAQTASIKAVVQRLDVAFSKSWRVIF